MTSKLLMILMTTMLLVCFSLNSQLRQLETKILTMEEKVNSQISSAGFQENRAQLIKKQAQAVLSIRCEDFSQIKKDKAVVNQKWNGTASKVSPTLILTAFHLMNLDEYPEHPRVLPIKCALFSRGTKVGEYDSTKHSYRQIGKRDMVVMRVDFNDEGEALSALSPTIKNSEIALGQTLVLVTHPLRFLNDYLVSFGQVLNENSKPLLSAKRRIDWENSVITNMTASEGSSGSPLFDLEGHFIGMHVGGEREKGISTNYQIIFDNDFQIKYMLSKLLLTPHQLIKILSD